MAKGKSISKSAMWVLMGLLILGLAGFGATNLGGNIRSIGSVGDKPISVDQYARQLQNEIRTIEAQTGEQLPFARAQQIGLDRAVLQRLVRNRALDHETTQLGLSIGDEALREEILKIGAFQGIDGKFDREGYRFALRQGGLSEAEFETSLREEASRSLLQGAIVGGVRMPPAYARTLVAYVGEQRSFTWTELTAANLDAPIAAPTLADLEAFYEANTGRFMLEESKAITYAILTPDAMLDQVEVPQSELLAEYEARINDYVQPERRLVERLVFGSDENANQAAANLEVNGTTFNALVEERGLELADVDMGDVGRLELGSAGEQIFTAEVGAVVAQDIDDQLAGGATLEQLAEETEMTLGTLDWTVNASTGIAAYEGFRQAAAALSDADFPKIDQLDDGSIFAMRLDEALPERPNPFAEARADVETAWRDEQTVTALTAKATRLIATLGGKTSFEEAGLTAVVEEDQTRNAPVAGTPPGFMTEVFGMEVGDVTVLPGDGTAIILRLDGVSPASDDDQTTALLAQLRNQMNQTLAQDVFGIYADEVVRRAGPQIDQRALQDVHVNFP